MHNVAASGTLLRNNSALSSRVNECLHRYSINFGFNVKHSDLPKELGTILHSLLIITFNQLLTNLFLNHFLRFRIIRVSILHLQQTFLLCPLFLHLRLNSFTNNFLHLSVIIGDEGGRQIGIILLKLGLNRRTLCNPKLFDFRNFSLNSIVLRIMEHLIE